MCVCICVCAYACMHACMHVCMHACMYACMYVGMYVCMHVCMHACMHVCMHVCMHMRKHMHACMHVRMYSWMYACPYMPACLHASSRRDNYVFFSCPCNAPVCLALCSWAPHVSRPRDLYVSMAVEGSPWRAQSSSSFMTRMTLAVKVTVARRDLTHL